MLVVSSVSTPSSPILSPARQAGPINRHFGLLVGLAPEELRIGVLHPGIDHSFVGRIEGVLLVKQPGDQSWWQGRSATPRSNRGHERALDLGPVDQ